MSATEPPDLGAVVARLTGRRVNRIGEVLREPLQYDAFLAGRTLVRVRGTADADGRSTEWSFVEKSTDGPATASPYLYSNGQREVAAYRSGLLADLAPGLRAPQLLALDEGADGRLRLWLEDLAPMGRPPLTRDDVLRTARRLGRLAGRWIGRVPDDAWLFRGWIDRHGQPEAVAEGLAIVGGGRGDPSIDTAVGARVDEARRLISSQREYAAALARLTPTLCHHDAVAANVFPREDVGVRETVLIDWESVGPGPVGADLASLLFSSARRGDFSAGWLPELMPAALEAYRQGLADVGADVADEEVTLGVHASIALRWTLVRDVVRAMTQRSVVFRGSAPHETPDQALAELAALVPVLLDSAAAARRLMAAHERGRVSR
jgi:hypothetical protein